MEQLKQMLEAYRNGDRPMPTYAELAALVVPRAERESINCRDFHELAMSYRAASFGSNIAYIDLVSYIDEHVESAVNKALARQKNAEASK